MIDRYLYADISQSVRDKCFRKFGGSKFLFFEFPSEKAKHEHARIMKLPIAKIYEFLASE